MTRELFERIRGRCRDVAGQARHVHVALGALGSYAREIASLVDGAAFYDEDLHFRGSAEETVAYVVTLDAVNFGSGYFPHLAKRPRSSGYGTVAQALRDRFRALGPISAAELARITPADCAALFGQDPRDAIVAELMALFAQSWSDLGRDLLTRFDGSFTALVEAADGSALGLIAQLERQPLFHDVCLYRGEEVPFYKRAQILVSDLSLALDGASWGLFRDLDSLTIFADNVVPHVLRVDGILVYEPDLALRIERGELLPAGSDAEVEIRACALHAVELMAASLRTGGPTQGGVAAVAPRNLDMALWNRGREAKYKATPRHRTRTTSY